MRQIGRRCILSAPTLLMLRPLVARAMPDLRELDKLDRAQAMQYLLDSYQDDVRSLLQEIVSVTSGEHRGRLAAAALNFELGESPFSFYAKAADVPAQGIYISLGGLSALDTCATAMALSKVALDDGSWWFSYLLYHRRIRRQPGSVWVEPFDAAGMNSVFDQSQEVAVYNFFLLKEMMTFILAHEAGHIAHAHRGGKRLNETDAEFLQRRRNDELAADRFALEVLRSLKVDFFGATYSMLAHLLLMQDGPDDSVSTHPADYKRLLQIVEFATASEPAGSQLKEFVGLFDPTVRGASAYMVLDNMAESVTRDSLRIWKRK